MSNLMTPTMDRFHSLDLIRGIAVLGILVMNVAVFANVNSYYMTPLALGETSDANIITWFVTHFTADQKFYTLFSMLFGAGIMLMSQRASNKGVSPTPVHMKRMGWLLLFGLVHGFFIWYGDILTTYALMGFWVYFFALRSTVKTKLYVGIALIGAYILLMTTFYFLFQWVPEADRAEMYQMFYPTQEMIDSETAAYKGGWLDNFGHRASFYAQTLMTMLFMVGPLRIAGAMLIGMALYQSGVLTAEKSKAFYWKFFVFMFAIAVALLVWDYQLLTENNFDFNGLWLSFGVVNSGAAVFLALAYIALLCLWAKSNIMGWLRRKFEAVGKMAFTNYIMQSLVMTTIFYGFGFGLFGELERYEIYYIVFGLYLVQLIGSELWLKKFYFGPLEWLWRTLTYGKAQPFSRAHS